MAHPKLALTLGSLSLLLVLATGTPAYPPESTPATHEFRRVEQPLWIRTLVTAGGLGLIGLELWWFVLKQPYSAQQSDQDPVQEMASSPGRHGSNHH